MLFILGIKYRIPEDYNMKFYKITMILLLCMLYSILQARNGVRLGFRAGYCMAQHYGSNTSVEEYDVKTQFRHGVAAGFIFYVPITESFGLQHEVIYAMKGSREQIDVKDLPVSSRVDYNMDYLEIPTVFRFKILQYGSLHVYGCSGFALSIMLKAHYALEATVQLVEGDNNTNIPISLSGDMDETDIFDFSFLYGGGLEFKWMNKTCFFEYRFTIGWNTLLLPTFETEDPIPLRNQAYTFMIGLYL